MAPPLPPPLPTLERRTLPEVRAIVAGAAAERRIVGWATRFNSRTILPNFDEIVMPGAYGPAGEFSNKRNVKLLSAHDARVPLGSVRGDTLKIRVVSEGLQFSARLPATAYGEELWQAIQRHDIDGASVGFVARRDAWSMQPSGRPLRTVHEADLYEISLTSTPAMADSEVTVVEARALAQAHEMVITHTASAALADRQRMQQQVEREAALIQALSPTLASRNSHRAT